MVNFLSDSGFEDLSIAVDNDPHGIQQKLRNNHMSRGKKQKVKFTLNGPIVEGKKGS